MGVGIIFGDGGPGVCNPARRVVSRVLYKSHNYFMLSEQCLTLMFFCHKANTPYSWLNITLSLMFENHLQHTRTNVSSATGHPSLLDL